MKKLALEYDLRELRMAAITLDSPAPRTPQRCN